MTEWIVTKVPKPEPPPELIRVEEVTFGGRQARSYLVEDAIALRDALIEVLGGPVCERAHWNEEGMAIIRAARAWFTVWPRPPGNPKARALWSAVEADPGRNAF